MQYEKVPLASIKAGNTQNANGWYGMIFGFDNGMTAKGIMRYMKEIGENGQFSRLYQREDGRYYEINMDKTTIVMADFIDKYIEGVDITENPKAKDWLKDNCYRKDRDNGAL